MTPDATTTSHAPPRPDTIPRGGGAAGPKGLSKNNCLIFRDWVVALLARAGRV